MFGFERLGGKLFTRRIVLPVVVGALLVALFAMQASASTRSHVRAGVTYEGAFRQTHYRKEGDSKNVASPLKFRVTPDGREVVKLNIYEALLAYCTQKVRPVNPHWLGVQATQDQSARIRRGSLFLTHIRATGGLLVVEGRFLAGGRVSGTMRFRGRSKYRSCKASAAWHAQVVRHPPVQQFTGMTAEGGVVTFDRTIEKHPHVLHFDFGSLSTNCGQSGPVTTGLEILPPYDEFELLVKNNSFSGTYYYGGFVDITGHFGANGEATGTVKWADADVCESSTVAWTAQPVG